MFTILSNSPLFRGLTPEALEASFQSIRYSVKSYSAGQVIAQGQEECKNLMILTLGSVKGEMIDPSGKIIKIEDIMAPMPLAPAFLFGNNNNYPVTISANEPVKLVSIPKEDLLILFQKNGIILNNFLNTISNRAQFLSGKMNFLSLKTIKGKLAQYLLSLVVDDSKIINLPHSQQELADIFGIARPSFARTLGELEQEGIINTNRRMITILDIRKLKQLTL